MQLHLVVSSGQGSLRVHHPFILYTLARGNAHGLNPPPQQSDYLDYRQKLSYHGDSSAYFVWFQSGFISTNSMQMFSDSPVHYFVFYLSDSGLKIILLSAMPHQSSCSQELNVLMAVQWTVMYFLVFSFSWYHNEDEVWVFSEILSRYHIIPIFRSLFFIRCQFIKKTQNSVFSPSWPSTKTL